MRHNLGWQSFEVINSRNNVSHLLGYNEPDRSDQANMSVAHAIEQWPEMFKSGLRLGSPAPSSTPKAWLTDFMAICDKPELPCRFRGYACLPTPGPHHGGTGISGQPQEQPMADRYGLPNGTMGQTGQEKVGLMLPGPQRDANMNIIYDENGEETLSTNHYLPIMQNIQNQKIEQILPFFDSYDLLEHHFLYNWVQDARSMILER